MTLDTLRDEARDLPGRDRRRCAARCTSGPRSATTCRSPASTCSASLDGLPLDLTLHETTRGIAALLTGGKPGPTVLLRGDMDALPLHEDTGLDFSSRIDGTMHACGHDTHTAMLVGAAKAARSPPATRSPGGCCSCSSRARRATTVRSSCSTRACSTCRALDDGTPSPVTGAFALHITSSIPTGMVATKGGPVDGVRRHVR